MKYLDRFTPENWQSLLAIFVDALTPQKLVFGSGLGVFGRAVPSDIGGPRFEFSYRQNLYELSTVLKSRK